MEQLYSSQKTLRWVVIMMKSQSRKVKRDFNQCVQTSRNRFEGVNNRHCQGRLRHICIRNLTRRIVEACNLTSANNTTHCHTYRNIEAAYCRAYCKFDQREERSSNEEWSGRSWLLMMFIGLIITEIAGKVFYLSASVSRAAQIGRWFDSHFNRVS